MCVFICQSHPTVLLQYMHFLVRKLYFNKVIESWRGREEGRQREKELQADILHTNRPQVDFQMCISKPLGHFIWGPCNSPLLWKGNFSFWEWIGENHFNWFDQQTQTCLYVKRNQCEHSITACRSCLAWRGLPGNAMIHNSVSNEIVVTKAEQDIFYAYLH